MYVEYLSRGFKKWQLVDLFTNELQDCSQDDFNDVVVDFRQCFDIEYHNNYQDFISKMDNKLVARRYYL